MLYVKLVRCSTLYHMLSLVLLIGPVQASLLLLCSSVSLYRVCYRPSYGLHVISSLFLLNMLLVFLVSFMGYMLLLIL